MNNYEQENKPTILLASDSTVQTYQESEAPQTGWGEMLAKHFQKNGEMIRIIRKENEFGVPVVYETEDITIENHAMAGRSSRSFLEEGRLDNILNSVKPGDYIFAQFGHNDANADKPNRYVPVNKFAEYLQYYIDGARQRKATCVLITPVALRNCDEGNGIFSISFPEYRKVMLEISEKQRVPLLDLGEKSTAYLNEIGAEKSKELFLWVDPGKYPDSKHAGGASDNAHLRRKGAEIFAGMIAKLITEYDADSQLDILKKRIK